MDIRNLSLEELYDLEKEHFPLAGSRTSVFLEPEERAGGTRNKRTLVLGNRGMGKSALKKVTFSVNAPHARTVFVSGDFTGPDEERISLKKQPSGVWRKTLSLPAGKYQYHFWVDGQWVTDAMAKPHQKRPKTRVRFMRGNRASAGR